MDRIPRRVFVLLIALLLALSWGVRLRAWSQACADPSACFSEGIAASGSDSYYWFRNAREILAHGLDLPERDALRDWPEGALRGPLPAYSWLIALAAPAFEGDVYRAGMALTVLLSSLFVVPLACFGRAIGFPFAGLFAGLVGALAPLYVHRSSFARVDTDGGTLFFMALLAFAIAWLRASAAPRRNFAVAALVGLCLAGFCRWYAQPGFWLVYAGTLGLHLAFGGFSRRDALRTGAVFLLFSNPLLAVPGVEGVVHFLRFYVLNRPDSLPSPLDYAYVTREITELEPLPFVETLSNVLDQPVLAGLGLAGFAALALFRGRALVPLLPIALLGLYALAGPQRFIVFLGPLIGLGLGAALDAFAVALNRFGSPSDLIRRAAPTAASLVAAVALLPFTGFDVHPEPRMPARAIASLQRLARVLPPDAAILANWGAGYAITDVTRAATFSDGAEPDPLVHYFFASALASEDPSELIRIVELLSTYGQSELHAALDGAPDPKAAIEALLARPAKTAGNVVLLLRGRDVGPFPIYFRTRHWDFERGRGPEAGFLELHCRRPRTNRLTCALPSGGSLGIDLARGRLSTGTWLRRFVELRPDGAALETKYTRGTQFGLIVLPPDATGELTAYLAPKKVYESNFTRLLFLGRSESPRLEKIHDDLPWMRAYRIRANEPESPYAAEGRPPSDVPTEPR